MITVTESACKAFLDNLKTDGSENKFIRVAVKGGGCAGMIFLLDLEDKIDEQDDTVFEKLGVKFVVDIYSLQFLDGTTIDFNNSLTDSGFKFINDVKRSCGCGKSFSI